MRHTASLVAGFTLLSWCATAQEVTLKGVSAFTEKTTYSLQFENFIERVNKAGKGVVQINYIGGPKAMPPFEVGNAVKTGVVDVANVTGAFYVGLVPEADAWKLAQRPLAELRKNGGFDYMAKIYAEKMNVIYLARTVDNNQFHLYVNKPIKTADLTGLKLRVTPIYRDFFQELGATVVQTAPGEVYTALERGVVDGYGWPITGIFDLGWQEKTKYRVDPGFYNGEMAVLVNKTTWDKLTPAQRKVLSDAGAEVEAQTSDFFGKENEKDTKRQAEAGIQVIKFEGAEGKAWLDKAYAAGWAGVARISPEHAPKLKELFSKPN